MSFNVRGAVQVSIDLFGGLVTQEPPENLPSGVSPDCQENYFRPGAVGSRAPLKKVFATAFGSTTVTYGKSYVAPDGTIRNLYLDALGNIWMENITLSAGTVTLLGSVTPGSYARSATAFGREYLAISDGLHGTDVPLQYDGTYLDRVTQDGPGISPQAVSLSLAASTITAMSRTANVVTVTTGAAHNLQVGYQTQIAGVASTDIGGGITKIVINNEDSPGVATITTAAAHGLVPGDYATITGVSRVLVGTPTTFIRQGDVVTVIMPAPHGLSVGSFVTLTGITAADNADGSFTVAYVNSATEFVYPHNGNDVIDNAPGGAVYLNWPLPDVPTPSTFEVIGAPTATTFQVGITYTDGTWTTGTVSIAWDGTFFVASVPGPTQFTYSSNGPPVSATISGGETSTPYGQIAPGTRQMQVLFLTRQGYLTRGSPTVQVLADGGQYLSVSDIPTGPPNVVARVLAFTGAGGYDFFYIPTPAQINGQVVSTATQINDNTTTAVTLDFSDNTLFAALGINTPGNDVPNQIVLDGALGFGMFAQRLITWGQRNRIQNLLNMSFDGGSCSRAAVAGWTGTGSLVTGHFSEGVSAPNLSQSFYEDYLGDPIATPNTKYTARCWATAAVTVTISSATSGFSSTATITPGTGGWGEAAFSAQMPAVIPEDLTLHVTSTGTVDDLSVIYSAEPYTDTELLGSYVDNPEAFDGVSGIFGAADDTRKVMSAGIIRETLYLLTQDPGGRVHGISANQTSEPVGWTANEIAGNCGAVSALGVAQSQADSATAAGGEEWLAWWSAAGARIFSGDVPNLISIEIAPDAGNVNPSASTTIWAMNDPIGRVIYFGLPMGTATAPNLIYPMDYKNLDTAYEIAQSPPVRTSFVGKLIAREHSRKWTRWNRTMNGAAMMYRSAWQTLTPIFFAGNGSFPNSVAGGYGNVYRLGCPAGYVDDDFGTFYPYYTTYFFADVDQELAMQLGGQRHMLQYLQWEIVGIGYVTVTPLVNQLDNPWPITAKLPIRSDPTYDDEWGGGQASGQRMAFRFQGSAT